MRCVKSMYFVPGAITYRISKKFDGEEACAFFSMSGEYSRSDVANAIANARKKIREMIEHRRIEQNI